MDRNKILNIVRELSEWFTPEAIKQIEEDIIRYKILIEDYQAISGFIIYEITNKKCYIKWMAVKRSEQGTGIGKKLIKKLIDLCKINKINKIETDTLAETENYEPYKLTRNFYHSMGFKDIRIIKAGYSQGSDKLILRKNI
jgi:ribosomal protein S18 acetylase RimI-like enzyme